METQTTLTSTVSPTTTAIEVRDLYRTYSGRKAVNGVSFAVLKGEIFGILGPNGAGKSTTLEMIEGLRQPDQNATSRIMVEGLNVQDAKQRDELHQRIGLQLQTSTLFDELTVQENLDLLAALYRRSRPVKQVLAEYDLVEKAKSPLGTLSGGQKQRVALAAAVINDPSIIFLDEPTTALDPQARRNVWDKVRELQQSGKTVILTTHYMEEAQVLCDRVAIMDNGVIVALDTPVRLIEKYGGEQSLSCHLSGVIQEIELAGLPNVTSVSASNSRFTLRTTDLTATLTALMQLASARNTNVEELATAAPSLEDVFINLTGKQLRD